GHVRQPLPLWNLSADSHGDSSGGEGDGMRIIENASRYVSRRGFLQSALASGAFVLCGRLIPEPLWAADAQSAGALFEPNMWLSIASEGTVTIVASLGDGMRQPHSSAPGGGRRT